MTPDPDRLHNMFLHFLNRSTLSMFGAEQNLQPRALVDTLTEYLVVAVLLADEYCLVPPGWVDEYKVTRRVLECRAELLQAGLICFPMRETTLDEFHAKRLTQYGPFREYYPDLFNEENVAFLQNNGSALIGRQASVGARIRSEWTEQSVTSPNVMDFQASLSAKKRRELTRVASRLAETGAAVAWPGVEAMLIGTVGSAPQQYRHLLQRLNFEVYLREYDLKLLSGIPLARYDFGMHVDDIRYDYHAFRAALESANAWGIVRHLDASSLSRLRTTRGFLDFRTAFDRAARATNSISEIRRRFALPPRDAISLGRETAELSVFDNGLIPPPHGYDLSWEQIQTLAARLEKSAANLTGALNRTESRPGRNDVSARATSDSQGGTTATPARSGAPKVAIFVALDVELRVLARRWNLQNSYGERLWRGRLGQVDIAVFSPRTLGRVQAALETFETLKSNASFEIVIVAGLAGGFERKGIQKGSLIIAESIVDLAARKMTEDDGSPRPVFRPREFSVDSRLREYLQSGSFDNSSWLSVVTEQEEWPDGLHPVLHYGPICSGDEVVSSGEWVGRLLGAWPMLLGVEMEAGGVCAAAERLGKRVAVIRVVSDFADPAKADDEWRVRGMKTIASLLETLDFAAVLRQTTDHVMGQGR